MEARWARDEAEATHRQVEQSARQGNTIMVFTIVTIVFVSSPYLGILRAEVTAKSKITH